MTINGGTIDNGTDAPIVNANNNAQNWDGDFTFHGTRSLDLGTGAVTLGGNRTVSCSYNTLTVGGVIADAGHAYSLTKAGASTLVLAGANTYHGTTTISVGILEAAHPLALQNSTLNYASTGGTITFGTGSVAYTLGGLTGEKNLALANKSKAAITLTVGNNAGDTTYSGALGGTGGSLVKTGAGTLTLSGINTFTGGTTISAGTLSIAASSALGLESNPLAISGGAVLKATDSFNTSRSTALGDAGAGAGGTFEVADGKTLDYTSSSVISGTGSLIKTGEGTLSLGGQDTYTGGTYIKAGTLVSTSGRAPGPQPSAGSNLYAHHIYDGATLQVAVDSWSTERQVELVGDQVGAGGAAKIDIINGFTQQRNGLIYGAGKLDLLGTGTMIVTGPNTYSGGTIIEHGVFQANNSTGSATGTGAVTVKTGGTLSGLTAQGSSTGVQGSVSGTVEIQSTGKLLTLSGGTLTLGGLTLDAGARSTFQLGALTSTPLVTITGTDLLTLPGASTIAIVNAGTMGVGTYHLFDYTGTALADISNLTLAASQSGSFKLDLVNNTTDTSIDLVVTAITDQWIKGGANTLWSTAGNWLGTEPNGIGARAQFINNNGHTGFGTAETATLDISKTVGAIVFDNSATAFTIGASSGQTLTLDQTSGDAAIQVFSARNDASHVISSPIILAVNVTVDIASGTYGLDISGSISGTGKALTKTDAGPLTLSGGEANTYTGLTEVGGGTLNLNKTPGINAIGSGGLQIDFGTTAALLAANQIAGSATVTVNGTFALGTHSETLAALGGGGTVAVGSGSVLTLDSATDSMFIGTISGIGSLAKAGAGSLALSGNNTYSGGTAINAGALQVGADQHMGDLSGEVAFGGGTLFFSGSFTSSRNVLLNSGGGTFDTDGSSAILTGVIRGEGTLTKAGTGTVKLSAANSYTGATIINNGILRISDALSLGTAASGTTVNASGEIELDGFGLTVNEPLTLDGGEVCNLANINTYGGPITLTANSAVDADAGTLIITSVINGASYGLTKSGPGIVELAGANTYTGRTTISAGTLSLSTGSAILDTGAVSLANVSGAVLLLNSSKTIGSLSGGGATGGEVNLGANTLTVGDANNTDYEGLISGTGGLTKTGGGTMTLAGANTYTGSTTVNAGQLLVNGSLASSSEVTVASAAKLGGTGTAAGAVAVHGTIAPGANGVGTLNTGAESWNLAGSYEIEINDATGTKGVDPGWDWLNITGTLTVAATSGSKFSIKVVSLSGSSAGAAANWNPRSNYRWRIATGTSAVSGFSADKFTLDTSAFTSYNALQGGSFSLEQSPNTYGVDLVFTRNPVTADPFTIGRAWGTYLRIPVADVLAKTSGGTAPITLQSVTSRDADFVQISGDGSEILFAPAGNATRVLDYTVKDSATPTPSTASSTITVTVTNAVSSVNSISSTGGTVTIRFAGIPGYGYAVERSGNLANWNTVWTTNAPAGGVWMFTDGPDPAPPNPSSYRLRQNN